ncbi:FixH family protein [Ectobacillus funiculus]|uniref:FixH family protein n=1 Tax=Ectobacillus funiculus TaxID=137993 RepID=A0ABV5WIS8_9BACI
MKYTVQFSLLLLLSLFLGGCSLHKDVEKLYKTEAPLEVNIILPEHVSPNKPELLKAVLTQDGKKINHADFVHFEIWKKDGSVQYGMEPVKDDGNGTYSLSKVFNRKGLYIIKVHAGNQGSMVMPRKQFVAGQVSEEELHSLKESSQNQGGSNGHHH